MARKNTGLLFSSKRFLDFDSFSILFGVLSRLPVPISQLTSFPRDVPSPSKSSPNQDSEALDLPNSSTLSNLPNKNLNEDSSSLALVPSFPQISFFPSKKSRFYPVYRTKSIKSKEVSKIKSKHKEIVPIATRIVVTKKHGCAVVRAKIKRRIKEAIRCFLMKEDATMEKLTNLQKFKQSRQMLGIVVIAKKTAMNDKFGTMQNFFHKALKIIAKKHLSE